MSQSYPTGALSLRHWSYPAAVMSRCLVEMIKLGGISPELVPPRVRDSAAAFFRVALEQAGDHQSSNPPASYRNYSIAANAMSRSLASPPTTVSEIDERLHQYAEFLNSMALPRSFGPGEEAIAQDLQKLFSFLYKTANEAAYERAVADERPQSLARSLAASP